MSKGDIGAEKQGILNCGILRNSEGTGYRSRMEISGAIWSARFIYILQRHIVRAYQRARMIPLLVIAGNEYGATRASHPSVPPCPSLSGPTLSSGSKMPSYADAALWPPLKPPIPGSLTYVQSPPLSAITGI